MRRYGDSYQGHRPHGSSAKSKLTHYPKLAVGLVSLLLAGGVLWIIWRLGLKFFRWIAPDRDRRRGIPTLFP